MKKDTSIAVGQIYEGQSKPIFVHHYTKRKITAIKAGRVYWEPVPAGQTPKYDNGKRWMTISGFFQWADKLVS